MIIHHLISVFILIAVNILYINSHQFTSTIQNQLNPFQSQQHRKAEQCNITHFQYQNNVSLGNNDQLNRTFKAIGQRLQPLSTNVTWKVNQSVRYLIYESKPTFYYRDTKQKAEIIGNDSIVIEGGQVQVQIDFKWAKIGTDVKNGTATVLGLSDQISFAKDIVIEGDFFRYDLLDYFNITFDDNPFTLSRIDPANMSLEQQQQILLLVNNLTDVLTLKKVLQSDIAKVYAFILKMSLHDENEPINQHFFYKWTSYKGDFVVNFTRRPVFIDIEKDGIRYGYQAKIDGFNNSKCGKPPRTIPRPAWYYGGSQEYISYTFYQNLIRYAIEQGVIDTQLNHDLWSSKMFQFYAGDLYQIFPKIAQTYSANTQISGNCKANSSQLTVGKEDLDTFNVTMHFGCQLTVNKTTKILDFTVGFEFQIQGRPSFDSIDFYLKYHKEHVFYYPTAPFIMQNQQLADAMIRNSLNRLYETKLFGSGWPLHPTRDVPEFEAEFDNTFVYDMTHVNRTSLQ